MLLINSENVTVNVLPQFRMLKLVSPLVIRYLNLVFHSKISTR